VAPSSSAATRRAATTRRCGCTSHSKRCISPRAR
jgi:hypothetical protein